MAALKAGQVSLPQLQRRAVPVPALGGDVVVRALKLTERLAVRRQVAKLVRESQDDSADGALAIMVPRLLALAVVDDADKPYFDADQWDTFGASHPEAVLELFNIAADVSGFNGASAQKN